ncbi:hypothetical protein HD553DRAFT_321996 [Filobasidium floriforme]|uniref:uncharacterized protein n=1 Tax=Filobasidium floriforme TaxID=5210 RepID=UPI001E8DC30B|nr:uncharacterized protein HD553DRAFT_321996 [Filobasidium floriforme]KAH8089137.1 hypothetical protein HD553DRAFT_321996 [Filobasidium floriforme]
MTTVKTVCQGIIAQLLREWRHHVQKKYQNQHGQFDFDTKTTQWLEGWKELTPVLGLINALAKTENFVSWRGTMTFTGPPSSPGSRTVYTGNLQLQAWWQPKEDSVTTEQYSYLVELPITRNKDQISQTFVNDMWFRQECSGSIGEADLNGSIVSTAPIDRNTASTMWGSSAESLSIEIHFAFITLRIAKDGGGNPCHSFTMISAHDRIVMQL